MSKIGTYRTKIDQRIAIPIAELEAYLFLGLFRRTREIPLNTSCQHFPADDVCYRCKVDPKYAENPYATTELFWGSELEEVMKVNLDEGVDPMFGKLKPGEVVTDHPLTPTIQKLKKRKDALIAEMPDRVEASEVEEREV